MTEGPSHEIEQLRAELDAARRELTAFNYSVSHDLRAPLRIIDGFSQALEEDYRDKLDEQAMDYLHQIRESAKGMERLINALVELSRVTTAPVNRQTVDVSDMAGSIAAVLKQSEPERNVEFSIEPGITVAADPALLRIAIDHLLRNSWKFTSKHPSARIEVGREEGEGRTGFFVRDDGAGFDQNYATRMFTPFQKFHPAAEFEGVGIGLATVQRIALRHGGTVRAIGKVEEGTTVYIDLG